MRGLAAQARQKGLKFRYGVRSNVPQEVVGDPNRIRQILVNLVGNAIKFTERGEVLIQVEQTFLETGTACLHFTVKDTGIGISEEKQKKIFEPFSQADGSTTRNYSGIGLGLTISTRLVQIMGGTIWVESGLATAARFTSRSPSRLRKISRQLCTTLAVKNRSE
jgi:two-component system sensor histidine kinase/response regulator